MTNYAVGHRAEKVAARHLQALGYKVYELNWRRPRAEIDIVAGQPGSGVPIFIEVKYRASDRQGSGLGYITPTKLRQMHFAAELWVAQHNYSGDYSLAAIELQGPNFVVGELVEL